MRPVTPPVFYEPILEELNAVELKLVEFGRQGTEVSVSTLGDILGHVLETPGKRVRPAITVLASKFHPHDHDLPLIMAKAVELLHIATLTHDSTIITQSYDVAYDFHSKAVQALQTLEDCSYKRSLLDLAEYVMERRQ